MAEVTYYVALPFVATDEGIAAGEPTECFNPLAVIMRAEALSRKDGHIGAVAFSRTGDPATGDFNESSIIRDIRFVRDPAFVRFRQQRTNVDFDPRWFVHLFQRCPLLGAKRKTSARSGYFAF
jgi:hypothetical protein